MSMRLRKGRDLQLQPAPEAEGGAAAAAKPAAKKTKPVFEVEAILDKRIRKGSPEYLISWLAYPEEANSWEPLKNLKQCAAAVAKFEKNLEALKKAQKRGKRVAEASQAPNKRQQIRSDDVASTSSTAQAPAPEPVGANNVPLQQNDVPESPVVEILGPLRSSYTGNNVNVLFTAIRADGSKSLVNNLYLKTGYPDVLLNYYEQHLFAGQHGN